MESGISRHVHLGATSSAERAKCPFSPVTYFLIGPKAPASSLSKSNACAAGYTSPSSVSPPQPIQDGFPDSKSKQGEADS